MPTTAQLLSALALPEAAHTDVRITKKLLLESFKPTAADKRQVSEGIESLRCVASLSPNTVGVRGYTDEECQYEELLVLQLLVRRDADTSRLARIVQRAVQYPILLAIEGGDGFELSAARKRASLAEKNSLVVDGPIVTAAWPAGGDENWWHEITEELAISRRPRADLRALYQSWIDDLAAVLAARQTGEFTLPSSENDSATRLVSLEDCDKLATEIDRLRKAAAKTTQKRRQVEMNLRINQLKSDREAALEQLRLGRS
jgi:hypothetical protein